MPGTTRTSMVRTTMIDDLRKADRVARKNFVYKSETVDKWRSHSIDAAKGKTWYGDCDDLASTACHLAVNAGIPLKDLWFAMVDSKGGRTVDHCVGVARVGEAFYIIGDTFGPMYPAGRMEHKLIFAHRLDWPQKDRWLRADKIGELI